ncbi:pentapeptide repeat-containing protein [Flavobacterium sp. H4147]|uniref:pentapeptide repeat-containing protein n=1 Tax=Flavobacterium sp. H4147 TaxID=3034149 RepID=UPI0023EDD358|nr:pentapeptide repeat-containing protein [Flavobacterium sp. H4147]
MKLHKVKNETKKYLKDRWKSHDFINSFPVLIDWKMDINLLNDIDLRGIDKLGCGEPFWKFPNIISANLKNIDLSFGNGSISISDSEIINLICNDFKFDRSSHISKSIIKNSLFLNSKFILSATDTTFENCDFSNSKFSGGHNEYGFRRCKFINCKFNSAQWKNTYLFACKFIDCDFNGFVISNSLIRGFKVSRLTEEINSIFENCLDVTGLIEINNMENE